MGVCATAYVRPSAVSSRSPPAEGVCCESPASVDTHVATVALPITLNAADMLTDDVLDAPARDADADGARDLLADADAERDGEPELEPAPARDADAAGDV